MTILILPVVPSAKMSVEVLDTIFVLVSSGHGHSSIFIAFQEESSRIFKRYWPSIKVANLKECLSFELCIAVVNYGPPQVVLSRMKTIATQRFCCCTFSVGQRASHIGNKRLLKMLTKTSFGQLEVRRPDFIQSFLSYYHIIMVLLLDSV